MTKKELKELIREVIEEASVDSTTLSKEAVTIIEFLQDNESLIASDEKEKQDIRRVRGYLESILTDEDYKQVHPGSRIGQLGGGDREDFARGT